MDPRQASGKVQFKVGLFTIAALLLVGAATVFVNDRPFWWRPCQLVYINVEDATGLKTKSPVRSLGIQIGYLSSVQLVDAKVRLGICVTAEVDVTPSTRAYIRGEGFLGDKFVELKPVRYVGPRLDLRDSGSQSSQRVVSPVATPTASATATPTVSPEPTSTPAREPQGKRSSENEGIEIGFLRSLERLWNVVFPSAFAEEAEGSKPPKDIPVGSGGQDVQELVNQVNGLVNEVTSLTQSLKQAIRPEELRSTMQQLNRTLENASRTLSPEGNLTTTAQRTLAKLEDAIEQLRDMAIRINKGEGSVGMLLNDPYYAESVKELLKNANRLLTRVGGIRFVVDLGASSFPADSHSRGMLHLVIWPREDKYYRLGLSVDTSRGQQTVTRTTTVSGGVTTEVRSTSVEENGMILTLMLGKVFRRRIDLGVGVLHSDGTLSLGYLAGPRGDEGKYRLSADFYYGLGAARGPSTRLSAFGRVYEGVYLTAGVESFTQVAGSTNYFFGAGITFDDEDIKILFAFR